MANEFRYLITNIKYTGSAPYNGSIIAELPFTNVNFTNQLNSFGSFQGELLLSGLNTSGLNVLNGTQPGKTILWVLYGSSAIWSGVIWNRQWDSLNQILSINAQEMASLYQHRLISTTQNFSTGSGTDPVIIAKNLLQYTEAIDSTNLQYSTTNYGSLIKKTYNGYELKSVYQAIKDLSSSYFDFIIKPSQSGGTLVNTFQAAPVWGTTYSSSTSYKQILEFPGNLVSYIYPEDGTSAANTLYGLGYGANSTKYIATYVDSAAQATYPLLEKTASYIDVDSVATLQGLTLGNGNAISTPPLTMQAVIPPYVTPTLGNYSVGDEFRVILKDDLFPGGFDTTSTGNGPYRCVAITVSPGENSPSRVTLTLTKQLASGTVS